MNRISILPLSAKTPASLIENQKQLAKFIKTNPQYALADIAYTLQEKREEFALRKAVICKDREGVINNLTNLDSGVQSQEIQEAKQFIFMFSGQGSQYSGMGYFLYQNEAVFKAEIDQCCEIFYAQNAVDIKSILFKQSDGLINETQWTQPSLFIISYALAKLLASWHIAPSAYIGHSVGELVAATLAGVFSLEDAIKVVTERARLMQSMPKGAMLAIQKNAEALDLDALNSVEMAVINSPSYCVVSGSVEAVVQFKDALAEKNIESSLLHTSHAFHSSMMTDAAEAFSQFLTGITLHNPKLPFISNVTGEFITDAQATSHAYWGQQIRQCVQFSKGVKTLLKKYNHALFWELGPGHTLSCFVRQQKYGKPIILNTLSSAKEFQAIQESEDDVKIYESLAKLWTQGYPIKFNTITPYDKPKTVPLPTYRFDNKRCWVEKHNVPKELPTQSVTSVNPEKIPNQKTLSELKTTLREDQIAQIFYEILGQTEFSKNDSFFDLGGTSLNALKLISKLKAINITISASELIKYNSVSSLSRFKKNGAIKESIIVPLKTNFSAKKQVFLIHPVGGTLMLYNELIKKLDPSYNYFGIQNIHIHEGQLVAANSLEHLAAIYIKEILALQTNGSFILMGSSLGGTIAFEMARQLTGLGKEVEFIAMFDAWATFTDDKYDQAVFNNYMHTHMQSEFAEYINSLSNLNDKTFINNINNLCEARWKLMTLLLNYAVPITEDRFNIHLFKAQNLDKHHINNGNVPDNGWEKCLGFPLHKHLIPGDHNSLLKMPGLQKITDILNNLLSQKSLLADATSLDLVEGSSLKQLQNTPKIETQLQTHVG